MKGKKILSILLTVILISGAIPPRAVSAAYPSAIDAEEFMSPGMKYRPGVRWWWPGNAASEEDLIKQVEYLAKNGFGAVEIVAFSAGFLIEPDGKAHGSIYQGLDEYDRDALFSYDTPEYYEKLGAVIKRANELGIIVDLNAGSGYLASDDSVKIEDSQSNMALGRTTITVSDQTGVPQTLDVPEAEVSSFYATVVNGNIIGEWSEEDINLNAVIVCKIDKESDSGIELKTNNQMVDLQDGSIAKTYNMQTVLDPSNCIVIDSEDIVGSEFKFTPETAGQYEVIAMYSVPSGSIGLNSYAILKDEQEEDQRIYVADHLNGEAVARFVNGWIGDSDLGKIVGDYDVRAVFNDSYEFYTDNFYNDNIYNMARDADNVIGYDIRKYIPSLYKVLQESFILAFGSTPVGTNIDSVRNLSGFTNSMPSLMTTNLTADENERIKHDYNRLVDLAFQEGMKAFSNTLNDNYGLLYRQQAYNPPIDTLKSSKYVDIPETEGEDEWSLKRATSGAHLYGKNLITSEVYTLGNVPFFVQPQKIKNGFDLMATSGVNNFFYHGLSATYYGTPEQKEAGLFGEEGWRAWPTIGVEMAETEVLSPYYKTMNEYASRANFVMQTGRQSSDIALYMPLFGSLSANDTTNTLNTNGYVWDAINDDCIQNELKYVNGKLVTDGGIAYSALIVDQQTLPVETISALKTLASEGAPVIFFGSLPNKQPGYANGDYEALDDEVREIAESMVNEDGAVHVTTVNALANMLTNVSIPPISYRANENARFNRRSLESGGELAYIRNTSATGSNTITMTVDTMLPNCYWLDQATGNIYKAVVDNAGNIKVTLPASGAIILLCEPAGYEMDSSAISAGLPLAIDTAKVSESRTLTDFTLTVTADNIGTYIPGEKKTEIYTENVLGDWSSDSFQNGALKYVSAPGIYATTFTVSDPAAYNSKKLALNLGFVNSAATIRVNGVELGQVFCAPYEIEIPRELLFEGTNALEIEVQPLKHNRRVGLRKAYAEDNIKRYLTYYSHVGATATLAPAGLAGPVVLNTLDSQGSAVNTDKQLPLPPVAEAEPLR